MSLPGYCFIDRLPEKSRAIMKSTMSETISDVVQTTVSFRLVAFSQNANSFGLHGHILVERSGRGFEAARCRYTPGYDEFKKGDDIQFIEEIHLATGRRNINWASHGFEIPRELPACPARVLRDIYPV